MSAPVRGGGASPDLDPRTPAPAVSIIGLGASGRAAARLALAHGESVYVSDLRTDAHLETAAQELRELGARVELGRHDLERIAASTHVVVSPGIPPHAPVFVELASRGIDWIGEPEFALRFHTGALIAITGTNGKTTTAALVAHLLKAGGVDAVLGGNVGGGLAPAASQALLDTPTPDWLVLEMSSYQLAGTRDFAPEIGVVTSLAPDHLDHYDSVEAYYADKARLFGNARPESQWVLNAENPAVPALAGDAPGTRHLVRYANSHNDGGDYDEFIINDAPPAGRVEDGVLTLELEAGYPEPLLAVDELGILGRHNVLNALMAAVTARLAGASLAGIREGLASFRPLPHRMQPVGEVDGVLWVNDSKATNVEATGAALESLDRPIVALLGGKDKGEDFTPLRRALARATRAAVLYGEARLRLEAELAAPTGGEPPCPIVREDRGFDEAVETARGACVAGDLLLLSPACSSFDLFENYEARGRRFVELARRAGGAP